MKRYGTLWDVKVLGSHTRALVLAVHAEWHFGMSIQLEYLIYCIEEYKRIHGTTGRETYKLFEHSGAMRYIIDHYDALHTAGIEYTLDDIAGML